MYGTRVPILICMDQIPIMCPHVSYSPSNRQLGNDSYCWNNKNVNFSNPGYEDGSWNVTSKKNTFGSQENGREVLQTHTYLLDATFQSGGE